MPHVAPFHGIRYRSAEDPAAVTAPPYDVISPVEREALEAASPYNIVRLILGPLDTSTTAREGAKYTEARALLDAWLSEKVLVRDEQPALTVYEEQFELDGRPHRQVGILGEVEISDDVLPHERTMGPIVQDRLDVLRAVEANLSPVFCLYWSDRSDAAEAIESVMKEPADMDFRTGDGVWHRAWKLEDPDAIAAVSSTLANARVVIADGHHRYRTAQTYRDERRAADGAGPWDRMLLYLVDAERNGPALLPIHRVVSGVDVDEALTALEPFFDLEEAPADAARLNRMVAERRVAGRCYGLLARGRAWLATLRDEEAAAKATEGEHCPTWRDLDVAILHAFVFDGLLAGADPSIVHHPHEAEEAVEAGEAAFAVLLAATPVSAVRDIAEAADSMPPKSTFFMPKPRTGVVVRSLNR